ncbi:MAG: plastocyanin/azurin family copper-binding protein [Bacteroidota bacterium]
MNLTFTKFRSIAAIALIALFIQQTEAQNLIQVEVRSNVYIPADITISLGDTVEWTNVQGFHNVNATQATYPSNPESFGNDTAPPTWVFTHVFNIEGVYDYQCDPHVTLGMVGTVTVQAPTSVSDLAAEPGAAIERLYPVPTTEELLVEFSENLRSTNDQLSVIISDLSGREVFRSDDLSSNTLRIDTRNWAKAIYVLQIRNRNEVLETRKVITQ